MSTLTIRLPEENHNRLRRLAEAEGISMNKLIDELATTALAQRDAEVRFRLRAAAGSPAKGLKLLDKLDRHFRR